MPVSRRRRDEEDDEVEEEAERPKRRRPRDEDEEPEERPRRRRRPRDEDDDEEERPAKKRRRARDDDDDDDDDDDEDLKERRPKGSVRKGWSGHKANKAKGSDFPEDLKITNEPELVKFLEDEPFVSYRQHWIDSPPNGIKKKSWTCLEDDCPLCDLGDRPRTLTSFNVLHISTGSAPENKIMTLGNKAVGQLEGFAADSKTGPLTRLYWAISKSGKGTSTAYNFRPVKVRDLEEDWDVQALDEDEIDEALESVYDETAVQVPTKKQLREIAEGLLDDDYDDD